MVKKNKINGAVNNPIIEENGHRNSVRISTASKLQQASSLFEGDEDPLCLVYQKEEEGDLVTNESIWVPSGYFNHSRRSKQ
jgi:hypothetical protein